MVLWPISRWLYMIIELMSLQPASIFTNFDITKPEISLSLNNRLWTAWGQREGIPYPSYFQVQTQWHIMQMFMGVHLFMKTKLIQAGKAVASGLLGRKCILLVNPKLMVPSWTEVGARHLVARTLDRYITIGNFRWGLCELVYYITLSLVVVLTPVLCTECSKKEALRLVLVRHVRNVN